MDPVHDVAFVRIAMEHLALPEDFEPPELLAGPLVVGDEATLVALGDDGTVSTQEVRVERVVHASFGVPSYPRFQERDVDFYRIGSLDRPTLGGVLVDRKGRITGLMQRYPSDTGNRHSHALHVADTDPARQALDRLERGYDLVPTLGIDLWPRPLIDVREVGLSDALAARVREHMPDAPEVLEITRVSGDAPARGVLQVGDWVLAARGETVTRLREVEDAVLAGGPVPLTVVRDGEVLDLEVEPLHLSTEGTRRAVLWAGSIVQEEPPEVAFFGQTPSVGVYLSWFYGGSPAQRHGTGYGRRLVELDGEEVRDLDHFLELVDGLADGQAVRLVLQDLRGEAWVVTLELDLQYWPTQVFEHTEAGWTRRELPVPGR